MKSDDPKFLSIARSIGSPGENRPKAPVVRIRKIQQGDTFASLAKSARIPNAEAQLRLLNQRYPSGELEVGQIVKVIE
jgi:predicted Zn-dependent protease